MADNVDTSVKKRFENNSTNQESIGFSSEQHPPVDAKTNTVREQNSSIPRIKSIGNFNGSSKPERRVLVLYTGGTIGMVKNKDGALVPIANAFVKNLKRYPHMHDTAYADERFGSMGPLVLPATAGDTYRVVYNVMEYSPLLDSSNITMDDWIKIATDIRESYEYFDGFVVLHGTDTLSYTASALSFMLEALGKIVVITGSQLSIFETRTDGLDNFLSSLVIAATYNTIPEVCVFFANKLMRGNRTSKISADNFEAFHSPNCAPLATAGIKIEVDYRAIYRQCNMEKFHVHSTLNRNVGLLRLFPSITSELIKAFLQPPIEGVILQSYGAGNVPSNREDIIIEFRKAIERGVIIVNITQCSMGCVVDAYESGKMLVEAGVISGLDMTPEAALAKVAYVLSKTEWDHPTKRKMMDTNLRGELTAGRPPNIQDYDLVDAVARSMNLSSISEVKRLGSILFPAMLHDAVVTHNRNKLDSLCSFGADISQTNVDGRTALHVACCDGNPEIVRHLLKMGANVHIKDRFDRTALTEAIENDHHDIIRSLLQCGAHLHGSARSIGEKMCHAAAAGNIARLQSYYIAGADLSQEDYSQRTPLHVAALHNKVAVVKFLLEHNVEVDCKDMVGHTPLSLAKLVNATEIVQLLESPQYYSNTNKTDSKKPQNPGNCNHYRSNNEKRCICSSKN